ncbi:MFS transporter [Dactylosporangium vinaceum]|uniref:MFS transporter n=1 Tax=Dactylosporangium vinaceum TaxID=53362 RepID=A0ABV5M644_9ACTN|nr:MFS transporter [Dactylosporangium vinaceum]UAB97747.1 MFS transporter [Dactylosporangium vinaceum]
MSEHAFQARHRARRQPPGLLIPLRNRDFRLLWTGMSGSLIGDGILLVAMAWQVYGLSDAPAAMSVVGFALTLPQVVTLLFGGVVSDRFDRRKIMLAMDVVRGAVLAVLAALSLSGAIQVWHIVALVAVYGAASGFFGPAFDGLVPTLVDGDELVQANAIDQFVRPAALQMAGPSLGGVLIAAGGSGLAFAVDAATFAVSAACLVLMRPRETAREETVGGSVWTELKEGMDYVRGNVWLWGTFVAATFTYLLFIGPTEVLLPLVVKHELHGTAGDLGLILASGGVGAIAAALIVGQRGVPKEYMKFIYCSWTLATLAVAGYGLATASWTLAIACALVNGLEAAGTIAWATAKQRLVPEELMGRVSSVDWFISISLVPLSYAMAAPVANAIGIQNTLIGAGVLGAVVTLAFLYLPGMRSPKQLVEVPA